MSNLKAIGVPLTFTFSWTLYPVVPQSVTNLNPLIGDLRNGELKHYYMAPQMYSQSGTWLRIHIYIDATRRNNLAGLNGFLYISNRKNPGPEGDGCSSSTKYCSVAQSKSDYMSCSVQLDPCELSTKYSTGIYFSVVATYPKDELWFQEDLSYTVSISADIVPTDRIESSPFLLDTGDVVSGLVADNQYTFFRVPSHKGSITITLSSPDYIKPPSPVGQTCIDYTVAGVTECLSHVGCGWCNKKCMPCTGKVGGVAICDPVSIYGCSAVAPPPPSDNTAPTNPVFDHCSSLTSGLCLAEGVSGVCGWCSSLGACGSCVRNLASGASKWCPGEVPKNCERARLAPGKRSIEQVLPTYKPLQLQLIISYDAAYQGPSCDCWKPFAILDVREGEYVQYTLDACRSESNRPLYVGVYGAVSTNYTTPWMCILDYAAPMRLNSKGDVECMSLDGVNCLWNTPCNTSLSNDPSKIVPLTCGEYHRIHWGITGYDNPDHWCYKSLNYFNGRYHSYAENPYTISVKEFGSSTSSIVTLKPNVTREAVISGGDTQYLKLDFNRTQLLDKILLVKVKGHPGTGITASLGYLEGEATDNGKCLRFGAEEKQCMFTEANGGLCVLSWGKCDWRDDSDNRPFVLRVHRTGKQKAIPNDATDLYNAIFDLVRVEERVLSMGEVVPDILKDGLYHYYNFTLTDEMKGKALVIEAYFDAGRQLSLGDTLSVYMNTPERNYIAGDPSDCLCNQEVFMDSQKVLIVLDECDVLAGTYHLAVKASQKVVDTYGAKYTITVYQRDPTKTLTWDQPTDHSSFLDQRTRFKFDIPLSMIQGKINPNTTLSVSLSTYSTDVATMSLNLGNDSVCGCHRPIIECTTTAVAPGARPSCKFEIDWCKLWGEGQYYITVAPRKTNDKYTPIAYTLHASTSSGLPTIASLQPAGNDCLAPAATRSFSLANLRTQHFSISYGRTLEVGEIFEVFITNLKKGSLRVAAHDVGLATSQCAATDPVRCLPDSGACIIQLSCPKLIQYLSVTATSLEHNNVVQFSISSCITKPALISLNESPISLSVSPGNSKSVEVSLASLDKTAPHTLAFKMNQVTGSVSYSVTVDQGQCSGCSFFTRNVKCSSGICGLFLHWFELPSNWQSTRWIAHVSNPSVDTTLSVSIEAVAIPVPAATDLTTNVPTAVSIDSARWSLFRWTVSAAEAAKDVGLRTGAILTQVIQPAPVPDSVNVHRVMFGIVREKVNMSGKLTLRAAKGGPSGQDLGEEPIAICCLTAGDWYVYVWNGNPSSAWSVSVTPTLSFVSNHVAADFGVTKIVNVPKGSAITNVYIPFPGLQNPDPASKLIAEVTATGEDPGSSIIYYNIGGPSGPRTKCTWNIEQAGGLTLSRDWYSCSTKWLEPNVYWFGLVAGSMDREYSVTLKQANPITGTITDDQSDVWSTPIRSSPSQFQQFRFDLSKDHKTFGISLVAQIEILPESKGSVTLVWNTDQAAGAVRDCSNNRGQVEARRISEDSHTPGKISLLTCLETVQSIYIGVRPTCADGSINCAIDSPNNPLYRVRVVSKQAYYETLRNIERGYTLPVDALPGADQVFEHTAGQVYTATEYLRFLVTNIKWKSTPGNITIDWIQDGSCQVHTDNDDCNSLQTECAAIVFPCEYTPTNRIKFRVSVTQPVSYIASLFLGNSNVTAVSIGEERKVSLKEEDLALFKVSLRSNLNLVGAGDRVVIKLSGIGCGRVKAWINRGYGAGPGCNIGTLCDSAGCVLYEASACNLMMKDNGGEFFVTVRGLDQFTTSDISVQLKVSVIRDAEAPTKFVTMHDNEEHRLFARAAKLVASECSTESLPQFASCCGASQLLNNTITRRWIPDDYHYVYTIEGGHHLGYGANITVGVREQVERATIVFSPDFPFFCGSRATQVTCIATPAKPCVFRVNSCIKSTRQVYVWVNPDSVKWVTIGGPTIGLSQSDYQMAWVRVDNKEVLAFDVAPSDRLPSEYHAQFHPFWLLPGEMEYIQVSHPLGYETETNYHVRVEVEEILGGSVEISQNDAWVPCTTGECRVRECITNPSINECLTKYSQCICDNFGNIDIPPCFDAAAAGNVEQFDDDKADHLTIRALGSGTGEASAVRGRVRFHFWEEEEDIDPKHCQLVNTGVSRFFNPKMVPKENQIYKFTVNDMEEDYGGVRMSVNSNKVALANVGCAEKAFCVADGDSCSLFYRREATAAPRVAVYGDGTGKKYFGVHHFYLEASLVTVDIVDLSVGVTSVSPLLRQTGDNCLKPSAPQFYRFKTTGTADFLVVRLIAHNARAWINEGHVTYNWGRWVCDGRNTSGVCETVIACDFNKTAVYYIHVEGSSHELTVFEHTIERTEIEFGTAKSLSRFATSPYYAVRIMNAGAFQDDPMKNLRVKTTGQIRETWLTYEKFGDKTCRIPNSLDVTQADALNGETFIHTIPACHLPTATNNKVPIVLNILRKFHRSNDATCVNYEFTVASEYITAHSALKIFTGVAANPYIVTPNSRGVARSLHKVAIGALGNNDVVYTRVTRSNVPVTHAVWKSNYVKTPKPGVCSVGCVSEQQQSSASWLDSCWHCGGGSYDTVFVEVNAKNNSDVTLIYDLEVVKRTWTPISGNWTSYSLRGNTRDFRFFRHDYFNRTAGNAFEIRVTGGLGVEVEIFPADCHRREGSMDLQPIVYRCFPGQFCDISFPSRSNFGSKSTKESRIWSDDSLRIVIKGYNTDFQIRTQFRTQLCRPIVNPAIVPYCSAHLRQQGSTWGTSDVTWTAQDQWATIFADKLIKDFDCPVENKCQCKPVSDLCKEKIRAFACDYAFGTCSPDGFRRAARISVCKTPNLSNFLINSSFLFCPSNKQLRRRLSTWN